MRMIRARIFCWFSADQQFRFGIRHGAYNARNLEASPEGTKFLLKIPNGEVEVNFKIPGRMNVYNAMAAPQSQQLFI